MGFVNKNGLQLLLKRYGVRPRKRLGQHFLVDRRVLECILSAAELRKNDTVLEIGPGAGVLTQELAKRASRVIAIEKDAKMVEILRAVLKGIPNVEIIYGDILKIFNFQFQIPNYKVVANLPYYIVSPVIRKFLESKCPPREMVLMVQKEVAQRICAKPPKMNLLAVSVQFYAEPKIIRSVKKTSFWPVPKVDSAIIKIKSRENNELEIEPQKFFRIVRAGFSHPRKQLINNLSSSLKMERAKMEAMLSKSGVDPKRRAETLLLQEWITLAKLLSNRVK